MENYRYVLTMIQKLQSLKVEKMGQILCVKKVPFRKSGHKLRLKEKTTFLWFDLFLLAIIKHYISPESEFNKDFRNLNQKFLRQSQAKLWPFY